MGVAIVWQRAEGVAVLASGLALYWQVDIGWAWWVAVLLFFAPDLSFAAYAFGPRAGALGYNLVHIYGFSLSLFAIGLIAGMPVLTACGALWLAHAGFDRMLGYGLKAPEGFGLTHLGRIGKGL